MRTLLQWRWHTLYWKQCECTELPLLHWCHTNYIQISSEVLLISFFILLHSHTHTQKKEVIWNIPFLRTFSPICVQPASYSLAMKWYKRYSYLNDILLYWSLWCELFGFKNGYYQQVNCFANVNVLTFLLWCTKICVKNCYIIITLCLTFWIYTSNHVYNLHEIQQ
jgi:hypothetical protein